MKTYAEFYVIGYILENVRGDNTFYVKIPLSIEEKNKLTWHYQHDLDDPYMSFKNINDAIAAAKKLNAKKKFVRIMTYSTDNIENAKIYCKIKDENDNPIEIDNFGGITYLDIE